METHRRRDLIGLLALLVAILTLISAFFIPEVRQILGLDRASVTPSVTQERTVEATNAVITPTENLEPTPGISATNTTEPMSATTTPIVVSRVIDVEDPSYRLTDDLPSFFTRFWLDDGAALGSFLVLDTEGVNHANPIWFNDELVGVVPGELGEQNRWETELVLFVPPAVLHEGENELRVEAGSVSNNYDNFGIRNLRLEVNRIAIPVRGDGVEVHIDNEVRHIGDDERNEWLLAQPESALYSKFFDLPSSSADNALLFISTYDVSCANLVSINDNYVGNLPGRAAERWADNLQMYIPADYLQIGSNRIQIAAVKCGSSTSNYDDFMIRDLVLVLGVEQ